MAEIASTATQVTQVTRSRLGHSKPHPAWSQTFPGMIHSLSLWLWMQAELDLAGYQTKWDMTCSHASYLASTCQFSPT